ncbi:MAG: four helix bundle protein [Prevotella sp.]|jgi:four helix bundle protein|nr:four helix bundle protein [Prevotella sp.]
MQKRPENVILKKTEDFSDRIVKMYKYLQNKREGNVDILKQVLRSGTSIGANTAESKYAQSEADFLTKLTIALKEANETKFWLKRLYSGDYLSEVEYKSIVKDNEEIINILVKITGTLKRRMQK